MGAEASRDVCVDAQEGPEPKTSEGHCMLQACPRGPAVPAQLKDSWAQGTAPPRPPSAQMLTLLPEARNGRPLGGEGIEKGPPSRMGSTTRHSQLLLRAET